MALLGLEDLRILVVDDNSQMRTLLRALLRGFGFRNVVEAADAAEAFEIMNAQAVDIALVDWAMAPISGEEFARMIRTSPDSPNPMCTVIMVTGHSERAKVALARDMGVNSFLVKPVSARSLRDHLAAAFADNRPFVRSPRYVGPCRRRRDVKGFKGPWRRADDLALAGGGDDVYVLTSGGAPLDRGSSGVLGPGHPAPFSAPGKSKV